MDKISKKIKKIKKKQGRTLNGKLITTQKSPSPPINKKMQTISFFHFFILRVDNEW
jgi:hypothetical protein